MSAVKIFQITLTLWCCFILSHAYNVEMVPSPRSVQGESPHWDLYTQSLYYVDVVGTEYTFLRYCPEENRVYGGNIDGEPRVSFIIPVAGTSDEFAVGLGLRVGVMRWNGKSPKAELLRIALDVSNFDEVATNNFNDAKADPYGRFFGGTLRKLECDNLTIQTYGNLYRFSADQPVEMLNSPHTVRVSNGMAFNVFTNKYYYIDSCDYNIKRFDYDPRTGDISNEQIVISVLDSNGNPPNYNLDGMTIDIDGNLYAATIGGSKIFKIDPRKREIVLVIDLPVQQITSAAFGGQLLNTLYVTTAADGSRFGPQPPEAGHLYKITGLETTGLFGVRTRI